MRDESTKLVSQPLVTANFGHKKGKPADLAYLFCAECLVWLLTEHNPITMRGSHEQQHRQR
jgi:hypothetical protein